MALACEKNGKSQLSVFTARRNTRCTQTSARPSYQKDHTRGQGKNNAEKKAGLRTSVWVAWRSSYRRSQTAIHIMARMSESCAAAHEQQHRRFDCAQNQENSTPCARLADEVFPALRYGCIACLLCRDDGDAVDLDEAWSRWYPVRLSSAVADFLRLSDQAIFTPDQPVCCHQQRDR